MSNTDVVPELKQILGAMIFGASRALPVNEMRRCLQGVAEKVGKETRAFAEVKPKEIREALEALRKELEEARCGFTLSEVAGGYRLQSDASCGHWLKYLLNSGRPQRLSQPALETLAIVAYRQPVTRADIESVRGVNVDHMVKQLMELQLIKITGRSELPGRPFLYGTTQVFLEHFGLRSLRDLDEIEPMLRAAASAAAAGKGKAKDVKGAPALEEAVVPDEDSGGKAAVEQADGEDDKAETGEPLEETGGTEPDDGVAVESGNAAGAGEE